LRAAPDATFNVVDDYLTAVVWAALGQAFGPLATRFEGPTEYTTATGCPFAALYAELRALGAHLVVGDVAPADVEAHAERSADSLKERVHAAVPELRASWAHLSPEDDDAIERNAVGLMWVGHPATVQGGVLILQELLARPDIHADLRRQAHDLGAAAWTDARFRELLRAHVLELLRFRPPFPILSRDVPRATSYIDREGREVRFAADSTAKLLTIGALADPAAFQRPDDYWPGRADAALAESANRYLMFGLGDRSCIGKLQVVEILTSALAGLLTLPELRYADRRDRVVYDGIIVTRMRLTFA